MYSCYVVRYNEMKTVPRFILIMAEISSVIGSALLYYLAKQTTVIKHGVYREMNLFAPLGKEQ